MDEAAASRHARLAFAALIVANLFLAAGPWMVRLADVGPVAAGFWRLALAIPFLGYFAWRSGAGKAPPTTWLIVAIVIGGLFFAADLAAWHAGIHLTKLANATLFGNSSSFLFAIYGFVLMRTLPTKVQGASIALAMIGITLLLSGSYELSPQNLRGDLLAILAGVFYCFYLIAIDRARKTMAPMPVLAIATAAGALPLLLFAIALGEQVMPGDWLPVILLSAGSQLIGQGLLVYAMGHLSPVIVGVGLLTQPVAAAVIGWFAYRESFGLTDLVGAILICIAMVLIRLPGPKLASDAVEDHGEKS